MEELDDHALNCKHLDGKPLFQALASRAAEAAMYLWLTSAFADLESSTSIKMIQSVALLFHWETHATGSACFTRFGKSSSVAMNAAPTMEPYRKHVDMTFANW
jgi:hypothetical protein